MAGTTYYTTYKRFNGSDWDTFYFRTLAGLVAEQRPIWNESTQQYDVTDVRRFLTPKVYINGVAFDFVSCLDQSSSNYGHTADLTLTGGNIKLTGMTAYSSANYDASSGFHYLSTLDDINKALSKLDKAVYDAGYDNLKIEDFDDLLPNLTAIENLGTANGTGFLKKSANAGSVGAATWELVQLYGNTIPMTSASGAPTIKSAIDTLENQVNGMSTSYGISATETDSNNTNCKNTAFNATGNQITINLTPTQYNSCYLKFITGPSSTGTSSSSTVLLKNLKIGDSIFITQDSVPDRWLAAVNHTPAMGQIAENYQLVFYKLQEYTSTWSSISGKPTINISTSGNAKTIHLPSSTDESVTVEYTATSSNPTAAWGSAVTVGTVGGVELKFTMPAAPSYQDTLNTTGGDNSAATKLFLTGMTAQTTNNGSSRTYTNSNVYIGTDNCLYSNGKKVNTNSVFIQSTAPSTTNVIAGDLWFDTATA